LDLPVKEGQIIYTGVVEADGKTKDELYKNAQQAFIKWLLYPKQCNTG